MRVMATVKTSIPVADAKSSGQQSSMDKVGGAHKCCPRCPHLPNASKCSSCLPGCPSSTSLCTRPLAAFGCATPRLAACPSSLKCSSCAAGVRQPLMLTADAEAKTSPKKSTVASASRSSSKKSAGHSHHYHGERHHHPEKSQPTSGKSTTGDATRNHSSTPASLTKADRNSPTRPTLSPRHVSTAEAAVECNDEDSPKVAQATEVTPQSQAVRAEPLPNKLEITVNIPQHPTASSVANAAPPPAQGGLNEVGQGQPLTSAEPQVQDETPTLPPPASDGNNAGVSPQIAAQPQVTPQQELTPPPPPPPISTPPPVAVQPPASTEPQMAMQVQPPGPAAGAVPSPPMVAQGQVQPVTQWPPQTHESLPTSPGAQTIPMEATAISAPPPPPSTLTPSSLPASASLDHEDQEILEHPTVPIHVERNGMAMHSEHTGDGGVHSGVCQMPQACKYKSKGCQCVREAWIHEKECPFRDVECPDLKCTERVCVKDLLKHIKSSHRFAVWLGIIQEDYISRQYWNIKSATNFDQNKSTWVLTIWEYDDQPFISVFSRDHGQWYSWVYIVGNAHDAAHYVYDIQIANCTSDGERTSVQTFHGAVHPIDEKGADIIALRQCMVITDDTVKRFMSSEGLPRERMQEGYDYRLPIEYKVSRKRDESSESE